MNMNSLSDEELWNLILKDDYRAFTLLFQRHWLRVYNTATNHFKDPEACEEIVQDLFLNIWNRRQHLTIRCFDSYLKAAARYQVYTYLKRIKPLHLEYQEFYSETTGHYELNRGLENILYLEMENELNEQLKLLPERCQEIFLLSRKEYLANCDIAERLGISKRSVENQIALALKHLRSHLKHLVIFLLIATY